MRWISVGLAVGLGVLGMACDGKGNGGRLPGVRGAQDATQKLTDFMCSCAEEQEAGACEEDDIAELYGGVDYACVDRVLAQHPGDRAAFNCQVDLAYDMLDCMQAAGCPEIEIHDDATSSSEEPVGGLEPDDDEAFECFDLYDEDACPELSDAFLQAVEECVEPLCLVVTEDGTESTDCEDIDSSPGCDPATDDC